MFTFLQKDPLVLFQNKETLISPCLNKVAYESKYTVMSELVYVYTCIPNGGQGYMALASTLPVRITCERMSVSVCVLPHVHSHNYKETILP